MTISGEQGVLPMWCSGCGPDAENIAVLTHIGFEIGQLKCRNQRQHRLSAGSGLVGKQRISACNPESGCRAESDENPISEPRPFAGRTGFRQELPRSGRLLCDDGKGNFRRGETGTMVSNSASSTGPRLAANHAAGWLSREGVCDICAVDGRFAIMTTSSFAFSPLRPVSYTGS